MWEKPLTAQKFPNHVFFSSQDNVLNQQIFVRIKDNVSDDDPSGRLSALSLTHIFVSDPHLYVCFKP